MYAPRGGEGRHATWLELFFDLVFVLAIAELARYGLWGLLAIALAGLTVFEVAYARHSSGASGTIAPRRRAGKVL